MNRRQRAAVAVLTTVAAALAAGIFVRIVQDAVGTAWWDRLRDAQTALEANQTALNSAPATGQDTKRLRAQCTTAVHAYNQAATHLELPQLDPTQECTP